MEVQSKNIHTFKHILSSSLDTSIVTHPCQSWWYLLKAQMMSDALFGPFLTTATLHLTPCHIHCRLEHIFTILHQLVLIKHKRKKHLLLAQTMLDKSFGPFFLPLPPSTLCILHIRIYICRKNLSVYNKKRKKKLTMPNNTSAVIQACESGL